MTNGRRKALLSGAVVAALALCALLLWLRHVDKTPQGRARTARIPGMARNDTGTTTQTKRTLRAADNDFATIQCSVQSKGGESVPAGTLTATAEEDGAIRTSVSQGSDLVLIVPAGRWTLLWSPGNLPTGYPLGTVDLVEGEVFQCALSSAGVTVTGRVLDPDGEPLARARLQGCGARVVSDAEGQFAFTAAFNFLRGDEKTCQLRARWEDGLLARFSEPATVSALTPGPHTLVVDPSPVAGMGITIRQGEESLEVGYVHPGTPAEDADLRVGDLLLMVDGHDTAGMSSMEFIPYGVGKEGSTVVLEIEREGQQMRKSFRRERIVKLEEDE